MSNMDTAVLMLCCFAAGALGAICACIFWARVQYQMNRREAKKLIARALGGTEVETKRSWRTIRRK